MNINSIISTCDAAGISFAMNGDKLVIRGNESIVAKMTPMLREHKEALKVHFSKQFDCINSDNANNDLTTIPYDLEERISIIQNESGLPEAWAEAFARLDCMARPASISQSTWQHIINNTGLLLDNHINDIITHGWSIADIFGIHKNVPEKRVDCMGLLTLLGEAQVTHVLADKITIKTKTGRLQDFYKTRINNPLERVLIWEL